MNKILYGEVLIICFILLCHILISVNKKHSNDNVLFSLKRLIIAVLIMLIVNFVWVFIQGKNYYVIMYISEILYLTGSCFVSYLGYLHIKYVINEKKKNKIIQILLLIPIIFIFILSLFSINNGFIFKIDSSCYFQHGSYFYIICALMLICPIVSLVKMVKASITTNDFNTKINIRSLVLFCFFLLIATVINLKYSIIPIIWPLASICLIMYYIDFQEYSILNDCLTGINNRLSFNHHLLEYEENKKNFFLMIIDVDDFKKINDLYGHAEGDKAIKKTAELLKKVVAKYSVFLARYGGDEFAIIGEEKALFNAKKLKENILLEFKKYNLENKKDYKIKLSIGSANYQKESNNSITKLFELADQRMYENKKSHKKSAKK